MSVKLHHELGRLQIQRALLPPQCSESAPSAASGDGGRLLVMARVMCRASRAVGAAVEGVVVMSPARPMGVPEPAPSAATSDGMPRIARAKALFTDAHDGDPSRRCGGPSAGWAWRQSTR